jgi:cobalt-zinc-cadmium efflux system membrane fusion protein
MKITILSSLSFCLATFVLSGCGRSSNAAPQTNYSNSLAPALSVKLSPSQLDSIKIGLAQTYEFSVEREAEGSVNFADDPAIIQAESALLGAAASYDLTHKELGRVKALGDSNGIPQKELEQATADEQTASAALRAARDAVSALGKSNAQINHMISTGNIESSPNGRTAAKFVVANVVESDSPLIRSGQPVEVSAIALPDRSFNGVVTEVYSNIDPNSHRLTVRTEIADAKNELRPGMLTSLVIQVGKSQTSLFVPDNGVVREGDGTMTIWVTADRRAFSQRIVKTGLREDGRVQILDGLRQGELVVTDGAIFLDNLLQSPPSD